MPGSTGLAKLNNATLIFLPRSAPTWWALLRCSSCAEQPDWGICVVGVITLYCHACLPGDYRAEATRMLMQPEEREA